MRGSLLTPRRTALLLLDLQPAVLASVPEAERLLRRARSAVSWARASRTQVGYVRVAFTQEDYGEVPAHNTAFSTAARTGLLAEGSADCAVHASLRVLDGDMVVRQTRFSAFTATGLNAALRGRGIDTLVIGGISTAGVVLSTVRQAADEDYRLFVLADVTADPDREVHRILMERVLPQQAGIIDATDLWALSDGSGPIR